VRSAVVLFLAMPTALAQNPLQPVPLDVRGSVVEGGSGGNFPVASATITVSVLQGYDWKEIRKLATDPSGAFAVRIDNPGEYLVRAEKPGYTDDGRNPVRHSLSNQARVSLDKERPSASVRLVLVSEGELTGRVVDADTGKPIENLKIHPITLFWSNGKPIAHGHKAAKTDREGRFVASRLEAGRYLVEVRPQQFDNEELLTNYSAEDLTKVDRDFQRAYWPGGGRFDVALPVQVLAGNSTDVGTIKARKGSFYRVHLEILADGCAPGEKVEINTIMLRFIDGGGHGTGECGKDFLVRNFEPGEYSFYVVSGSTEEDRKRVIMPVEVIDKNLDVLVPLARGVDINGRIVVAEGAGRPRLEKLKIQMAVMGDIQFADEQSPISPDSEGRFRFMNRPIARARIAVSNLPADFDVKEIRYNGGALTDNIVALNAYAPAHVLEIEIDDKPAQISGAARDGDKSVPHARVILMKWPVSNEDMFLSLRSIAADEDGKFQFAGLAPGEYRMLAVVPESIEQLDEPHVLEQLLSSADRVTLTAGATENRTLRVIDPER